MKMFWVVSSMPKKCRCNDEMMISYRSHRQKNEKNKIELDGEDIAFISIVSTGATGMVFRFNKYNGSSNGRNN